MLERYGYGKCCKRRISKDVLALETSIQEEKKHDTVPLGISGLGGWLILVQIGLFVSVIGGFISIFTKIIPTFDPAVWEVLTTPGTEWYHPLWGPLVVFETIFAIASLVLVIYLLICFYLKKSFVPRLFIILYAGNLMVTVIDSVLMSIIHNATGIMDESTSLFSDVIRNAITCAIWIPYFLKSERVANTFVR